MICVKKWHFATLGLRIRSSKYNRERVEYTCTVFTTNVRNGEHAVQIYFICWVLCFCTKSFDVSYARRGLKMKRWEAKMSLLSKLLSKAGSNPIFVRCRSSIELEFTIFASARSPLESWCRPLVSHSKSSLHPKSPGQRWRGEDCEKVNLWYLNRFSLYGAVIHGPFVHLWLSSITRLVPGTTPLHVLFKVVTDQVPSLAFDSWANILLTRWYLLR